MSTRTSKDKPRTAGPCLSGPIPNKQSVMYSEFDIQFTKDAKKRLKWLEAYEQAEKDKKKAVKNR